MRRAGADRLATLRARLASDDGFTMIDVVVTMVILGIVMALFSSAMYQIYGAQERTETTANSQSQIVTAFQRLDKQIRYASAISRQGAVGAD
jgi:prepilin-type N-terminal cleavage/methylation domain-containing protein